MNKFPIFLASVILVLAPAGLVGQEDDAANQYREAQDLVQEAMKAKYTAEAAKITALQKYELAISSLNEISTLYPAWNPDIVRRRILECEKALADLRGEGEAPAPAAAVPAAPPQAAAPLTVQPPVAPPPAQADADFVGHKASKKVHRAECLWAQKMAPRNRVYFNTYEEAAAQGYTPCKVCKPDLAAGAIAVPPAPPPGSGPATTVDAPYIGHKGTKTVHLSTCQWAHQMAPRNRVPFNSYAAAEAAGYHPSKSSKPDLAATPNEGSSVEATSSGGPPETEYWASKKGKTFHRPRCEWAKKIPEGSLVKYATRDEAIAAGKAPCEVCLP